MRENRFNGFVRLAHCELKECLEAERNRNMFPTDAFSRLKSFYPLNNLLKDAIEDTNDID